ncbi:hypothetical protein [Actinomadura sp. WMMB 499]|uniref:hypothetical protein n=1 Tax=Actinomadura sp. WMMB 499 TaxID=1219491 RepID=UPI00159D7CF8|nr:hypothetical protein [Actinomadura sp. WMMB 499]
MDHISDPEVWVTLRITMHREIRELRRLIRLAEKDGDDPVFLKNQLELSQRAYEYVCAA